nr:hypothetical protein [Tanacetum cinerariifolium]
MKRHKYTPRWMERRKTRRKDTELPQTSVPIEVVADEVIYEEMYNNVERAATTATGLDTQVPKDHGNAAAQTSVLDLEKTKTTQAKEIANLKKRVKRLEKKKKSRSHGLKRLYKVGLCARVESSAEEESLEMFDADRDLQGEEVVARQEKEVLLKKTQYVQNVIEKVIEDITTADIEEIVSTASPITTAVSIDDIILAQEVVEIKSSKPKARGVVMQEPSETPTTITIPKSSRVYEKEKLQAKQEEEEEEERISREKVLEVNIAEWDNIQAMMDADYELAARLQEEVQGELTIEEKSSLFMELMDKRKKHFAKLRLKNKSFDEVQKAFNKTMSWINSFVPMDSVVVKDKAVLTQEISLKRVRDELDQERSKKQKVEDDKESEKLKRCLEIILDDGDDVTINATPLSIKTPIIDYKIYKEGKKSCFQIFRANGNLQMYYTFSKMLKNFDKEDLKSFLGTYEETFPVEDPKGLFDSKINNDSALHMEFFSSGKMLGELNTTLISFVFTYTSIPSSVEDYSDIGSPEVDGPLSPNYVPGPEELEQAPLSPNYVPGLEEPEQAPLSPDYLLGLEEPEQAPPSPVYLPYVPELVYPEYMPPEDDVFPAEEQPLPVAATPTADSPGYIPEFDPEEDEEEDHEEDPADSTVVALPAVDHVPSEEACTYYCQLKVNAAKHKLTTANDVNLTIYTLCIEQFWATAKTKNINGEAQIHAKMDGKKVVISEATIRRDLKFDDEGGVDCLSNEVIFEQLPLIGAKTTAWNEFSSTMASAVICLATDQKFNFSKYIFDSMVKNLDSATKILMFPRFIQVSLNNQLEEMANHTRTYVPPSHTKKIFGNMKMVGKRDEDIYGVHDQDDTLMFDADKDLQGEEVVVEEVNAVSITIPVSAAATTTTAATTPTISMDEKTLAKSLIEIKTSRPKAKGIFMQEPSETPTPTPIVSSQQLSKKKVDADYQLEERLHEEEKEQFTDVKKGKIFMEFMEKRRKLFAAKRDEEKRKKPLTKAQQRSIMTTYLKNMDGWKPRALKSKTFAEIKELFDKAIERINSFVDFRTELVEENAKKDDTERA